MHFESSLNKAVLKSRAKPKAMENSETKIELKINKLSKQTTRNLNVRLEAVSGGHQWWSMTSDDKFGQW